MARSAYLSAIHDDGERTAEQIGELRDRVIATVEIIRASRARSQLKRPGSREPAGTSRPSERAWSMLARESSKAIDRTRTEIGSLQGHVSDLEKKVQEELRAAKDAAAPGSGGFAAAPGAAATDSVLIWPIDGTVTSPFDPRWRTVHEGIDIGAAEGNPIAAAPSHPPGYL